MPTRFHTPAMRVNPGVRRAFHRDLTRWYRRHHRQLPWRSTRDPYRIWVSEIMLQQTRVETVRPYYTRWLREFPTVRALARASNDRVLKLWEGLGYYSRARNLHRAAHVVVTEHRGKLPRNAAGLLTLPGIGRYTAGAIASIAFGEQTPLVDGNVARVFARIFGIRTNIKSPATLQSLWQLAEKLLPPQNVGDFNQALMELGALICTPANPQCDVCPMHRVCVARVRGLTDQLPNRGDRPRITRVVARAAYVTHRGRILLQRRPKRGLLADFWELPEADESLFKVGRRISSIQHAITNRRITLEIFECTPASTFHKNGQHRWVMAAELERLALPAAHRRALGQILLLQ